MNMPDFSISVSQEARLFLMSCLLGIPIGMLLDGFRLLRALLPHHKLTVFLEDALLAFSACLLLQFYASAFARSDLRYYFAVGALLGLCLWVLTVGAVWMRMLTRVRSRAKQTAAAVLRFLWKIRQKTTAVFVRNPKKTDEALFSGENT